MSTQNRDGLYIYQLYGTAANCNTLRPDGLFAVAGLPLGAAVTGLTRAEAETVLAALTPRQPAPETPAPPPTPEQIASLIKRLRDISIMEAVQDVQAREELDEQPMISWAELDAISKACADGAAALDALAREGQELRAEWESCCSREASTFAELKERRTEVKRLTRTNRSLESLTSEQAAYIGEAATRAIGYLRRAESAEADLAALRLRLTEVEGRAQALQAAIYAAATEARHGWNILPEEYRNGQLLSAIDTLQGALAASSEREAT